MSIQTSIKLIPRNVEESTTTPLCSSESKACLPPHEVERICKAFIRLILAKETTHYDHNKEAHTEDVVTDQ